jgi:uncharacterized protein
MKFSKQPVNSPNSIRSYSAQGIQVGDQLLSSNCLISAHQATTWNATDVDTLTIDHFQAALALQPEIILLGTGARIQFPHSKLIAHIMARGIGFEVMDLGAACRTFNVLLGEDRKVVAALLLG